MDSIKSMKVFVEVVETSSFRSAAKRLTMSPAMASKHVAHLESTLHTRLLHRSSRSISLTESGTLAYERCREALEILNETEVLLGQRNGSPRGKLRITAPQWLSNPVFARKLIEYQQAYPHVQLELFLDNQKADLASGWFDLALRVTENPALSLIARPIATVDFLLIGAPAYFARAGRPSSVEELPLHRYVMPILSDWANAKAHKGNSVDINGSNVIRSNDTTLILQLARQGFGLAYLPRWIASEDLRSGSLEFAIPGYIPFSQSLYAMYVNRRYLAPKVRTFIDFMVESMNEPM